MKMAHGGSVACTVTRNDGSGDECDL